MQRTSVSQLRPFALRGARRLFLRCTLMMSAAMANDCGLNGCTIDVMIGTRVRNERTRLCRVGCLIAGRQNGLHQHDSGQRGKGELGHTSHSRASRAQTLNRINAQDCRLNIRPNLCIFRGGPFVRPVAIGRTGSVNDGGEFLNREPSPLFDLTPFQDKLAAKLARGDPFRAHPGMPFS
jgi:hypothetical protein